MDHPRWPEFVAKYRPMMEAYLNAHFPTLEADDVIQETFAALCGILPGYIYDPDEKGHFRNYLTGILRNKARRALCKSGRQAEINDMTGAGSMTAPQSVVQDDDQSYRESLFELALRQFLADGSVADRTKRIFERTALNGESPEAVAAAFKMTRHAVDQAKSRAMARLREIVKGLETLADG